MGDNKEHMHYLEFSCQSIEIIAKPGISTEGSFVIYATDKLANGKIYSSDTRMRLIVSEFSGQQIIVQYCFEGVTVEYGKQIKGEFVVISNYGEYTIPYTINVEKIQLNSSLGEIKNLFHFANLAQSNWKEAVEIFYSPEFKTFLKKDDSKEKLAYLGLSHSQGNERNVEEFLIEVNKKLPITYSFDIEGFELEDVQDSVTKTITITKSTWGYVDLQLKTEGDFLVLKTDKITSDDFEDNNYSFSFGIDASMLHKGINSGNIILSDSVNSYKISVDILMENYQELKNRNKYKKESIRNMVKAYVDMKFLKHTKEQWIDLVSKEIDKLNEYDEGNVLVELYQIQMLIYKERFNEAKWHLDKLEKIIFVEDNDIISRGYYLFLTTLFNRDESYIQYVCDEISTLYANHPSEWWLAWFLIHLDDTYTRNDEQKWKLLEQLYKKGCVSPIVFCDAVLLLQNNPTFLLKLDKFEENVLWHAARNKMLTTDLLEQVQYLTARKKDYSAMLVKILAEAYKLYKSPQTVSAICRLLINGDKKGKEYLKWYELGVEYAVRVTKLYEYYMMSLEFDKYGNVTGEVTEIPKMVLMYFAYQSTLDYEINAFLYAYVIKNKEKYPDLEQSYKIATERFVIDQIKAGRINENLAYLYQKVLVPQMIIDDIAYSFSTLLFMHCIYVNDSNVKNIIVIHEKIKGESLYPVVNDRCLIPIYGSDYKIFLQDENGNRFTKSSIFEDKHLMKPQKMLSFIEQYMKGRVSFDLYLCEFEKDYIIISSDNVKRYKNLAESSQVAEEFKKEIRVKLLRFYYDNDMIGELDAFLEDVEADEMQTQERAEFIRYLISRGMFEKAYLWVRRYGSAGVNPKSLARLISKTIVIKKYEYDEFLVNVSYYIFENMKFDEIILCYLLSHYEGKLSDLKKLWDTAVELELNVENIMCKILKQIKYTGVTIQEKDLIITKYSECENCDRVLVRELLKMSAYDYFVNDAIVLPQIFDEIYEEYVNNELDDRICNLALLKYWAETSEYLEKIDKEIIRRIVKRFLVEDIYFPFYKGLAHVVPELHYFKDRMFVEHKTVSGKKVSIHYIFEDMCGDLDTDSEASKDEAYEVKEMKEMYDGIYIGMFMLFHGEAIQYYITEKGVNTDEVTEDKIEVSDILFGDMQTEDEESNTQIVLENRFTMLNDIMISIDMNDELTSEQLVEEYLYKDFCTRELFRII